jgi:hypothetical protein
MKVQIYNCERLPSSLPGFIDPDISVYYDPHQDKNYYTFQVNLDHPFLRKMENVNKKIRVFLKKSGFKKLELTYSGELP